MLYGTTTTTTGIQLEEWKDDEAGRSRIAGELQNVLVTTTNMHYKERKPTFAAASVRSVSRLPYFHSARSAPRYPRHGNVTSM
jgi:hypothetical protein